MNEYTSIEVEKHLYENIDNCLATMLASAIEGVVYIKKLKQYKLITTEKSEKVAQKEEAFANAIHDITSKMSYDNKLLMSLFKMYDNGTDKQIFNIIMESEPNE